MRFFHSWHKVPDAFQNAVVAIGNFDGFHQGHKAVVQEAVNIGKQKNLPVVLMTFEPHPSAFFRPSNTTFRVTPIRSKVRSICQLPLDAFFVFAFNPEFSEMSAERFVEEVLINGLHAAYIVVGEDYGFGKNRSGDIDYIREHYPELPITSVTKLRDSHDEIISSSRVRAFIKDGNVSKAASLLGRPFEIEGRVVHGFQRGRTIGFPTINIEPKESILPKNGVYAARVEINGKLLDAVANIGARPTVNGEGILLEAHILDFNEDLYGQRLRVQLIQFIRPEKRFSSMEELKENIIMDIQQAKRILA